MDNSIPIEELGVASGVVPDEVDPASQEEDLISLIMQCTALPSNVETQFLAMSGQMPIRSYERPVQLRNMLDTLLTKARTKQGALAKLFVTMLNQGNFIEIECELTRQLEDGLNSPYYQQWQQLAQVIVSLRSSEYFSFRRLYISQVPFVVRGSMDLNATIDDVKKNIVSQQGVPQGVDINEISWDTISFKVPPMGIEYFSQLNPQMLDRLDEQSVGLINQLQNKLPEVIKIALAEARQRYETFADPVIPDYTIFLENMIGSAASPRRGHLVRNAGDAVLIQYLNTAYPMFIQGIIPGTILPSKVTACQDIVTMTELRGSIQYLAQEQIIQKGDVINQPNIKTAMEFGATENDLKQRWTVKQAASIRQAQNIDRTLTQGLQSIQGTSYNEQADLGNQVAGGSNTMRQQLQMSQRGAVVKLNYEQTEMLRQQLSMLLACLRIRFDSVQASKTDMVPQEDIDHFIICEVLAKYLDPLSQKNIHDLSVIMREAISEGHNVVKLKGIQIPQETLDDVTYRVQSHAETILRAVPFFEVDLNEGGQYFAQLLDSIYLSLTDHNRIETEKTQRYARRKAISDSFKLPLQ